MIEKLEDTNKRIKLDMKSRKILYELDVNARQSCSQIGKKVGLSKDTVNNRIKKMEKLGIIKGYYTILDISKLGYLDFRVFIKLYNTSLEKEKEIINYLVNHPRVGWLVSVTGNWDINMLVWAESVFEYKKFWDRFVEKYGDFVLRNWVSVIMQLIHYKKAFLIDLKKDSSEPEISGGEVELKVDKTDIKILKILSVNSRVPILEIAKKLNISQKTIAYRIKKLVKKKVILSFRALLDLNLLGLQYYKAHFTLKHRDKERYNKLLAYARSHPNIMLTNLNVGGADFEVEIYIYNPEQFHLILQDMKHKFSDLIIDVETLRYYKEYKWIYIPIK